MKFCPYYVKGIKSEVESFEDHLMNKHFSLNNNNNMKMPEEGATMKFEISKTRQRGPS